MTITPRGLRSAIRASLLEEALEEQTEIISKKGTLNTKKVAEALGVDAAKLAVAVRAGKENKLNNQQEKLLANVFIKLVYASADKKNTVIKAIKAATVEAPGSGA